MTVLGHGVTFWSCIRRSASPSSAGPRRPLALLLLDSATLTRGGVAQRPHGGLLIAPPLAPQRDAADAAQPLAFSGGRLSATTRAFASRDRVLGVASCPNRSSRVEVERASFARLENTFAGVERTVLWGSRQKTCVERVLYVASSRKQRGQVRSR